MTCVNHLKQFGLAVHNHHDAQGSVPPATIGRTSTRAENGRASFWVFILPYMEQQSIYDLVVEKSDRFSLPLDGDNFWNDESTATQTALSSVKMFLCPSRRSSALNLVGQTGPATGTGLYGPLGDYAIVVGMDFGHWGDSAAWDNLTNGRYANSDWRGPFLAAVWTDLADPKSWRARNDFSWWADGTSNQFIIGEKCIYAGALGRCDVTSIANVGRAYSGDCSIFAAGNLCNIPVGRSFNGLIANIPNKTHPNNSAHPPPTEVENQELWGSFHPGICNFLLGDGSVRPVSVTIPAGALKVEPAQAVNVLLNTNSILAKMGHVNDGSPVSLP